MIYVGDEGEACTPLTPGGFVMVAGNRLPARCESGYLELKQAVTVIGGDNLGLIVRSRVSAGEKFALRDHGQVVYASFGAKVKSEGERQTREQNTQTRIAVSRSIWLGGVTGLIVGLTIVVRNWLGDRAAPVELKWSYFVGAAIVSVSLIWGVIFGRAVFGMFERMGYTKLSGIAIFSILFTLTTAGFTFSTVFQHLSLIASLFSALSVTVVSGSGFLALALLGEWMGGDETSAAPESGGDPSSDRDRP
jgi:hypothetical protein